MIEHSNMREALENALTTPEREDLAECEAIIRRGRRVFLEVGEALARIRDRRLYRASHDSFEAYCIERWDMSRPAAYRAIDAAQVVGNLSPMGDIVPMPTNERQIRPLAGLEPDEQREVWQESVSRAGGLPTGRQVEETVADINSDSEDERARAFLDTYGPSAGKREARVEQEPPEPRPQEHARSILTSSESNEWYTSPDVISAVREVLGCVDLDPASCAVANRVVRASRFYTIEDDGLSQPWPGRLFVNPPYGRDENHESNQAVWSQRLIQQYDAGVTTEAILLVNSATGNAWFRPLMERFPICFPRRIHFYNPEREQSQPTHSNALIYLGQNEGLFAAAFNRLGPVLKRMEVV